MPIRRAARYPLHVAPARSRHDVPRVRAPRPRLRGRVLARRAHDRHLLPAHVPRAHAQPRERRVLRRAGRGAARGLPAVPANAGRSTTAASRRRWSRSSWSPSRQEPGRRYRDAELARNGHRSLDGAAAVQALLRHDVPGLSPRAAHGPRPPRHQERKDRARLATGPGLRIRQRIPRSLRPPRRHRAVAGAGRRRAAREVARDAARRRCSRWPTTAACTCSISSTGAASSARWRCCRSACSARVLPGEHRYLAQIERELAEYFAGTRRTFETPVALTGSAFQTTRVERAAGDSRRHHVLVRASSPARSASRRPCAPSAAPTATTGCRSSCPAIA